MFVLQVTSQSIEVKFIQGQVYSTDSDLAQGIAKLAEAEEGEFGIVGTPLKSGPSILSDEWATFLFLQYWGYSPQWINGAPPVPSVPKGAVA